MPLRIQLSWTCCSALLGKALLLAVVTALQQVGHVFDLLLCSSRCSPEPRLEYPVSTSAGTTSKFAPRRESNSDISALVGQ